MRAGVQTRTVWRMDPASPSPSAADDYDSPWKDAIQNAFAEFMAFYFPQAASQVDWQVPPEFLETELRQVVQDAELGRRHADVLAKVACRDGTSQHVYVHVEVQGGKEAGFEQRMFVYHYRLFDRFQAPVASFAVLADEDPGWRPDGYGYQALGVTHTLQFGVAKLLDHEHRLDQLQADPNPFALVTAAHLLTRRTRGADLQRFEAKRKLVRLLYQQNRGRQRVIDLFAVLDWMMRLPPELGRQIWQDVEVVEREGRMRYVTSVERFILEEQRQEARQEGLQVGLREGRQEGRKEGELLGQAAVIQRQLTRRFGALPPDALARLRSATQEQLQLWTDRVLDAGSLAEVFGGH